MINYHYKNILISSLCCGLLFLAGTANALSEKHVQVGVRSLNMADTFAIQEKRALKASQEDAQENSDEEVSEQPSDSMIAASREAKSSEEVADDEAPVKKKSVNLVYSTHPGAFHKPLAVSIFGESVQLEDSSIWTIYSGDRHLTLNWLITDDIIVVPNLSWFSMYQFKLKNLQTGAVVEAGLTLGPDPIGIFTHWIIAIDKINRQVCLEDGSVWSLSSLDTAITNKWLVNDTIIIGINEGILSGIRPNILINVNMNNYSNANCLFY